MAQATAPPPVLPPFVPGEVSSKQEELKKFAKDYSEYLQFKEINSSQVTQSWISS